MLVFVLGILFAAFAITDVSGYGSIGVGWTLDKVNFWGGLLRMLFPFTTGMLLQRTFTLESSKTKSVSKIELSATDTFIVCSIKLFAIFIIPYLDKNGNLCTNGIYEFFCIAVLFPGIVKAGASAQRAEKSSKSSKNNSQTIKVAGFLGELSYPLYIVHYPVMYLFYSWLIKGEKYTLGQSWYAVIAVFAISLALAYITLKFYDLPLRKRLLAKAPVKDNI